MALERLKTSRNVTERSAELGIYRTQLYKWRDQTEPSRMGRVRAATPAGRNFGKRFGVQTQSGIRRRFRKRAVADCAVPLPNQTALNPAQRLTDMFTNLGDCMESGQNASGSLSPIARYDIGHVQEVIQQAHEELRQLMQQRADVMKRIGTVKQTI